MNYKYLVIAGVLWALASPLPAQSVKAGIEAWQKSDYSAAVAIWRPLAENGDADAAFNLGQAYRLGRGVPTNLGAAQSWFERAARKGQSLQEFMRGVIVDFAWRPSNEDVLLQAREHARALRSSITAADILAARDEGRR